MDFEALRGRARDALVRGLGTARLLLEKLPVRDRDALLREATVAPPDAPGLVESPRGAFHAGLIARLASPGLPLQLLEDLVMLERREDSEEPALHLRGVLCELLVLGAPLPPLPFYRWVEESGDLYPRLPALRALAAGGDPDRLRHLVEATRDHLRDPYDARDWGEAMSAAGPPARELLRELLGDDRPWVRLGAAYGLSALGPSDRELETIADIISLDPDPCVRVNAVELRAESKLPDPNRVAARLLADPDAQPFFDTWLWSFACEALPSRELPGILKVLEESKAMDCYDTAELLAASEHPLAVPLLRSRLYTADPEARAVYLDALERKGQEIEVEALELFPLEAAPVRVLVLRAQRGEEAALDALAEGILAGKVPPQELEGEAEELVRSALLPRVLGYLEGADPETWAMLMAHFRDLLPTEHRGPPSPEYLRNESALVVQEAAIELLEHPAAAGRARLARFLRDADPEACLPALEALATRPPPPDPDLVRPLLDSPDPRLRGRARRILLGWLEGDAARELLESGVRDAYGPNRSEALMVGRLRSHPLDLDSVRPLLFDALDETRAEAARVLVERDGENALEWLEEALEDEPTTWVAEILQDSIEALRNTGRARGER